jgi:hypothetical protein
MKKFVGSCMSFLLEKCSQLKFDSSGVDRLNLCCGSQKVPGYVSVDFIGQELYVHSSR